MNSLSKKYLEILILNMESELKKSDTLNCLTIIEENKENFGGVESKRNRCGNLCVVFSTF